LLAFGLPIALQAADSNEPLHAKMLAGQQNCFRPQGTSKNSDNRRCVVKEAALMHLDINLYGAVDSAILWIR
jgi:hypothetical protein